MERERFVDKIALVTGGANGLGRGMVEQLVKEGAQVAIFDIEDDTMEEVFGGNDHVFCVHCDVRDYDQVQESVQKVIDRYGRIDVLMNNAGICHREPFLECSKEGWLDVMATNLNGEFYVGQAVARTMVELGVKGYIVNTSSNSSRKTIGGITPLLPLESRRQNAYAGDGARAGEVRHSCERDSSRHVQNAHCRRNDQRS